jgi:hypothetical protein
MIITLDFSLGLLQQESCALLSGPGHVPSLSCGTKQNRTPKKTLKKRDTTSVK